jgi:vacuolar-type H+-ATPase subunit E/Vma4
MGRRELLEALHREGLESMDAIVAGGAAEEQRLRSAAEERRQDLLCEHERQRERLCSDQSRTLRTRAVREAALIRLRAEHALSLRLYERARSCLKQLRGGHAEQLFLALAAELPAASWQRVWVNPVDSGPASACYPGASIIEDETQAGGLRTTTADGSLSIDNSLETRLERVWPDLLPQMIAEIRGRRDEQP